MWLQSPRPPWWPRGAHTAGAVGSSPGRGKQNPACRDLAKKRFLQLPWWLRRWRVCLQCGRPGFDPWVKEIPWRREGQPTLLFLPGELHGQRSLAGYSPQVDKVSVWTDQPTLSVTILSQKFHLQVIRQLPDRSDRWHIASLNSPYKICILKLDDWRFLFYF